MSNATPPIPPPWQSPDWLPTFTAWVADALPPNTISAEPEIVRMQPWSAVVRVPTAEKPLYAKACAPMLAHETALTRKLADWQPERIPTLLASDAERGWLLMADAGTRLREVIAHEGTVTRWHTVLPLYANMQLALTEQVETLLALGVFDRRLARLPALFEGLLTNEVALMVGEEAGLTSAEFERLQQMPTAFAEMCDALASLGIEETLHHDDFHDANVLVHGRDYRFIDWGESCVTHPFFTLVVTLRSIAWQQAFAEDGPEITALRDSYLRPWTVFAPLNELIEGFEMAYQLGMINRALTWHWILQHLGRDQHAEHASAVPAYLREYLAATDRFAT